MDEQLKEKIFNRTRQMLDATVEQVMTKRVTTCDFNDPSAAAARMILENGFLGVLVMKDGRPAGMVTAFDLLRLGYEEVFDPNRDYLKTTLGQLLGDRPLPCVPSATRLWELLNLMVEQNLRTVAVIDDELIRGVVSMVDLVKWYRNTHEEIRTGRL
ncbi:MAG: CBS domain-containing protein [Spirochaetia bacterium]|nr:CBS domain-containing protein [Spirochaetia bacterium]